MSAAAEVADYEKYSMWQLGVCKQICLLFCGKKVDSKNSKNSKNVSAKLWVFLAKLEQVEA